MDEDQGQVPPASAPASWLLGWRRKSTGARERTTNEPSNKGAFLAGVVVAGWQAPRFFYGHLLASADLAVAQSSVRDRKAYPRATERWENEGGATLAGYPSGPSHSK
jgi:hypothetical protein